MSAKKPQSATSTFIDDFPRQIYLKMLPFKVMVENSKKM